MSLKLKFNLVFGALFALTLTLAGILSRSLLVDSARDETLQNARLLMQTAAAARSYTSEQVVPLLQPLLAERFLPQSVPSFAATESLQRLRKDHPEFLYKEAVLNPTNPRDRATDWEADVVQALRNEPGLQEYVGQRSGATGEALFIARPIRITDAACLACHSTPAAAPRTMIDLYGPNNGFGWKLNEVLGAQIVSVPTAVPVARAESLWRGFMLSLVGVFAVVFVAVNAMLHWMVTRRLAHLAEVAHQVSLGQDDDTAFETTGHDEIARLTQAFGRMRLSLLSAMNLIEATA